MSSLSSQAGLCSSAPLKRVGALQFGVFSSEQLRRMSVCEVTTSELYEHGFPKANGLNDLRLGTLDYRQQCRTCNMDVKNCPGHFGHINLVKPVYHYGFLPAVLRVLRCVCYACGRLLVDRRDPRLQHVAKLRVPSRRLKHVLDACANKKRCEGSFVPSGGGDAFFTDPSTHGAGAGSASAGGAAGEAGGSASAGGGGGGADERGGVAGFRGGGGGGGGSAGVEHDGRHSAAAGGFAPHSDNAAAAPEEGGCGCVQPRYYREGPNILIVFADYGGRGDQGDGGEDVDGGGWGGEDVRRVFAAEEALAVMRRISEEDLRFMGFDPVRAHPASFIVSTLPIPPLAVRPSVQYGSARSEDDLTLKLVDIVKTNLSLKRQGDSVPSAVLQEMTMLLQYHVTTLFDNDVPGVPVATTRAKKPIKSIRSRLKGKEGRLRGNLMGKRVDFSARTVITGDPMLPIDVVGVPKSIAMTLTYPEQVTPLNMEQLKQLVRVGPFDWPGAKYVIRDDGSRFDLRHAKRGGEVVLEVGYRVERHMRDGDFVLFNRQPSLHKMSIMGHVVKVLPYSTFRLNLSVTSPYNADFDGDEMNLHLAQSEETRAEIKHLMRVPKQIVSPQGNKPVMGIVQDSLLAVSKFTRRDTFLTKPEVFNLLLQIPYWSGVVPAPAILRPVPLWTGKQIFSLLLFFDASASTGGFGAGSTKTRLNMQRDVGSGLVDRKKENLFISERDERVIIRQGELLAGKICKKTVGSASGSLIHLLWLEGGPERTKDFLSTLQKVTNYWLLHQGFTVGCKDIIATHETNECVKDILRQAKEEVEKLIGLAHRGRLESQPGKSLRESFEARVNKELNSARERSGKVASESLDETNNIMAMVLAGSKGSTINISQIMACVGQQNVEGKRIPFGFNERSLPHFHKFDFSPQSRGFVENSYLSGLEPHELFFHAMGGREGIIDTACKTSETGYIQRRLMKAMEDVKVHYDRTVRNSICEVLQFLYGEDGMNGEYVEDQPVELMLIDNEKLRRIYRHDVEHENYGKGWILDEKVRMQILTDFELQQVLEEEFEALKEDKNRLCKHIFRDGETKQHLPINVLRLLEFAKAQFPGTTEQLKKQNPVDIARQINELLQEKLVVVQQTTKTDTISAEVQDNATIFMKAHLRSVLNSRRLLERERLGPKALQWLLGEVERQFHRALAHAGECVGAIAAQSIGEPATQMTLNTFHFAGVGSKNVTLGVPRLKELINVAKHVKTPSLTVYLQEATAMDQERAKDVQTNLEHTTLDRVTVMSQVIYDPDPADTIVPEDKQWVRDYYEFPDDDELPSHLGRWLLRIQMASKVMIDKKLTMKEIGEKIFLEFPNDELDCIWTDDNSDDLVLRVRIKRPRDDYVEGEIIEAEDRFLQNLMLQCLAGITLRGISGISKVYMREEARVVYNNQLGKFERVNNWVLDTDGCNLEDVLPIPLVDSTRTTSNDMTEIFHVLGIEAVRRALLRELRAVISFDGSYVNYRHLATLCDTMTQKGYLMSITRHGINRIDKGPLMKCSFEETVEILMEAAVFAETDYLRGVTENIMMGQLCPLGTGDFDVLIDEEKLRDAGHNLDLVSSGEDASLDALGGDLTYQQHNLVTPDGSFTPSPHQLHSVFSPMPFSTIYTSFGNTSPTSPLSPSAGPFGAGAGVDTQQLGGKFSPTQQTPRSPTSPMSPLTCFSPRDPNSPLSPTAIERGGSTAHGIFSPSSPILGSALETTSPSYSPSSPQSPYYYHTGTTGKGPRGDEYARAGDVAGDVLSPIVGGAGGGTSYSPTSPTLSPSYSPSSPPSYSPTSPAYSPTSGAGMSVTSPTSVGGGVDGRTPLSPYSPDPTSPHFSVSSPSYSPTSPVQNVASPASPYSPAYSPTSPRYSPTSPAYSPTLAPYSPQSPLYAGGEGGGCVPQGPFSPSFTVQSPRYSPSSPAAQYSPTSPLPHAVSSPAYSETHGEPGAGATGRTYSPTSPMYEASDPFSPDPFAADVVEEVVEDEAAEGAATSPTQEVDSKENRDVH